MHEKKSIPPEGEIKELRKELKELNGTVSLIVKSDVEKTISLKKELTGSFNKEIASLKKELEESGEKSLIMAKALLALKKHAEEKELKQQEILDEAVSNMSRKIGKMPAEEKTGWSGSWSEKRKKKRWKR